MSDFLGAGRLEDHPFSMLAGAIFREARSGELSLESGDRRRSVWFLGGNPVAVISDDPQDHLAQVLLEHGRIDTDTARRLSAVPETRDGIGSVDYIPKETLNWGVKFRFVNLCYDLFRWEDGDYAFREGNPPKELFLLKVPAHSLIFKGVGYLGQGTVFETVPDEAVIGAGAVAAAEARYLGTDERALLAACEPGRTVADVLAAAGEGADSTRRSLYALSSLGLISLSPAGASPQPAGEAAEDGGFFLEEPADTPPPVPAPDLSGSGGREFSFEGEQPRGVPEFSLPPLDLPGEAGTGGLSRSDLGAGGPAFDQDFHAAGGDPFASAPASGSEASGSEASGPASARAAKGDRGEKKAKRGGRLHLPRLAGVLLGTLGAAAVIAAAGWWWVSSEETPQPPVRIPARPAPPPAAVPATPPAAPAPETAVPPPADPGAPPAAAPAMPPATAPPAAPATAPAAPLPSGDRYRSGLEVFRAGDLDGAATIWEALLSESHRGDYTLSLLTACQHETIRDAQRAFASRKLYLVGKSVNGRNCFRVSLDTFDTREAAARALSALPSGYRSAGAAVRPVSDILSR